MSYQVCMYFLLEYGRFQAVRVLDAGPFHVRKESLLVRAKCVYASRVRARQMVGAAGFEPACRCLRGRCFPVSHTPKQNPCQDSNLEPAGSEPGAKGAAWRRPYKGTREFGRWGTDSNLRSLATRGLQPRCFGRLHTHRCGVPCRIRTCVNRVAAGHLASRPRGHGAVERIRTAITWLEARGSTVELEPHGAYHRTRTDTAVLARRRSTLEPGRHATVRVMKATEWQ